MIGNILRIFEDLQGEGIMQASKKILATVQSEKVKNAPTILSGHGYDSSTANSMNKGTEAY